MRRYPIAVSTHSRLKAAGLCQSAVKQSDFGFNTQPPEGGWLMDMAAELVEIADVSTHSRLKAAGPIT